MTTAVEPTEKAFQAAVIEYAELQGWRVFHVADSRRQAGDKLVGDRQAAGYPDLTLVRGCEVIFAELKTAKGRISPAQRAWLSDLGRVASRSEGSVQARLWRPEDWPEIQRVLTRRA